jgi:hypothetical protein
MIDQLSTMANAQFNVKFITNKRGGHNLAFDGYIYQINRRTDDKVYWRCIVADCPANISAENNIPVGFGWKPHTHPADPTEVVAKQITNQIK